MIILIKVLIVKNFINNQLGLYLKFKDKELKRKCKIKTQLIQKNKIKKIK